MRILTHRCGRLNEVYLKINAACYGLKRAIDCGFEFQADFATPLGAEVINGAI